MNPVFLTKLLSTEFSPKFMFKHCSNISFKIENIDIYILIGRPFSLRSRRRFRSLFEKLSMNSISFRIRGQRSKSFTLSCLVTEQLPRLKTWFKVVEYESICIGWEHIGYAYNKRADALPKESTTRPTADVQIFFLQSPKEVSRGDSLFGDLWIGRVGGTSLATVGYTFAIFKTDSKVCPMSTRP